MLELFLTFIIIFIPFFLSFMFFRVKRYILGWFIFFFIFFHVFHLVIIILLLKKNYYKKTIFWKIDDLQYIHYLPINPIKNINIYSNDDIKLEDFVDLKYTLKKTNVFKKECLNNFFIKEDNCPITDIILNNFQRNDYSKYIEVKISNNSYLYYTDDIINGTLYFKNDSNISDLPYNEFNFNEYNEKEKIKEKEIIKVIKDLKYYTDYSDYICLSLFIISLTLMILNSFNYSNVFQIWNIITQIILFILYLFRYIKFINLKHAFNKYKDFISIQYINNDSNEYFPNKYFNIDSFALALQINILLLVILYSSIFENCLIKYEYYSEYYSGDLNKSSEFYHFEYGFLLYSYIFCMILFYTTIIYLIKLKANLHKINYRLNNIVNNWEKNPIKSIFIGGNNPNKIDWKNNSLIYERLSDFNYTNIFYGNKYKESKICGKDSNDNDLYFPKNVECPLNSIIITEDENFDTKNEYIKLSLKNNSFLYYTNKKINGKIIINLINSKNNGPTLNFHESEEKKELIDFDIKSYSNIETFDNKYFLATYYIGVNQEILPKNEKIKNFDNKIKKYKKFNRCI